MKIERVEYRDFLDLFESEITLQNMLELFEKVTGRYIEIIEEFDDV